MSQSKKGQELLRSQQSQKSRGKSVIDAIQIKEDTQKKTSKRQASEFAIPFSSNYKQDSFEYQKHSNFIRQGSDYQILRTTHGEDDNPLFTNLLLTQQDEDDKSRQYFEKLKGKQISKSSHSQTLLKDPDAQVQFLNNGLKDDNDFGNEYHIEMAQSLQNTPRAGAINNKKTHISKVLNNINEEQASTSSKKKILKSSNTQLVKDKGNILKTNQKNEGVNFRQSQFNIAPIPQFKKQLTRKHSIALKSSKTAKTSKVTPNLTSSQQQQANQLTGQSQRWNTVNKEGIIIKAKNKFINLIKQKFQALSSYERKLIGDSADSFPSSKKQKFEKNNLKWKIFNQTFHPGSFPIILFKTCMMIVTLYSLMFTPLLIGFDLQTQSNIGLLLQFSGIIFAIEVFIKFRISIYEKGEIITDTQIIASRYFNSDFVFDIISIIGCALASAHKYFLILTLFRFSNLMKYMEDINNHYYLAERYHKTWTLTRLLCFIIQIAHYFACIFHFIAIQHQHDSETWIKSLHIENQDWQVRYNYAIYFSFITCITIGYGDITPKNGYERFAVAVFSLFSTMCVSFSVITIGNIFQDYFIKFQKQLFMRYNAINFMRNRYISKDLQFRVLKYIEYIHDVENESPENGLSIINKISNNLKTQIFQDYYGKILKNNKQFSNNYSKKTIEKIALIVKEKMFVPGENIFEQGESDYRLFYLIKGECEFYLQNKGGNKHSEYQSITYLNKNEFFGYKGFISGIPREMSCRSKNITHVFYIQRDELISILKEDPQEYEQFCKIRDQFLLYTNSFGEECFGCKNYGHTLTKCPRIHMIRNKESIALRFNYSDDQRRYFKNRRDTEKYSSRNARNFKLLQQSAEKIKKDLVADLCRKEYRNDLQLFEYIEEIMKITGEDFVHKFPYIQFVQNSEMKLCEANSDDSEESDTSDSEVSSYSEQDQQNYPTIIEIDEKNSDEINFTQNNFDEDEQTKNTSKFHQHKDKQSRLIKPSVSETIVEDELPKEQNIENYVQNYQNKYNIKKAEDEQFNIVINQINDDSDQNIQPEFNIDDFSIQNQLLIIESPKREEDHINQINKKVIIQSNSTSSNYIQLQYHPNMQEKIQIKKNYLRDCESFYQESSPVQDEQKGNLLKSKRQLLSSIKPQRQQHQIKIPIINNLSHDHGKDSPKNKNEGEVTRRSFRNGTDPSQNKLSPEYQIREKTNSQQILQLPKRSYDMLSSIAKPSKFSKEAQSILQSQRTHIHTNSNSPSNGMHRKNSLTSMMKSIQFKDNQPAKKSSFVKMFENQQQVLYQILMNLGPNQVQKRNIRNLKSQSSRLMEDSIMNNDSQKISSDFNIFATELGGQRQYRRPNQNQFKQQIVMHKNTEQILDLFIFEFDCMKEYQKYFPHNNASLVCQKFKKYYDIQNYTDIYYVPRKRFMNQINMLNI